MVAAALLEVYEATFERRWLDEARALADAMIGLFWDDGIEASTTPGAITSRSSSGRAISSTTPCRAGPRSPSRRCLRLAVLTGEPRYEATALKALRPMADLMARHASGFGRFLCALDFHLGPVVEIALVAPGATGSGRWWARYSAGTFPNRVVTGMVTGDARRAAGVPLLEGRDAVGGKPTAYVCRNYACELPVTDRAALARQLDGL